ncbi:class II fumarate hydratase [Thiohalobacter thiocyanaticus]|uniref:Fumarate hydratase class II n=1 Tax=Thiohalobacter thiocyanaticus TaxID=585455 RepID=A0A426QI36_9GAMM|nr:class II fumarate hydratase [Thiohalobacter thiocyanaticus]RRQ21410.1 class II fumarate hydratase [Thiohalobacter thiocyanaticus]
MTDQSGFRTERDSMGEVAVPADALYGAQTQRAVDNFPLSGLRMPPAFIHALGRIKACAARANAELDQLDPALAEAIAGAAEAVARGEHDDQFPIDVFQTGSGTSTNMNANEVIARLASDGSGTRIHPNDHVNRGQSSNDVIPTALHVSARLAVETQLLPALDHLAAVIEGKGRALDGIIKTGRTHLMDAMPVSFSQELGGWAQQVRNSRLRIDDTLPRLERLAQGGTAVGTGINAHPEFAARFCARLSADTGIPFHPAEDFFEALSCQDTAVELSGQLRVAATALLKIANDLRWMNSGPLTGLGEISLPALQPGSSIMPGKVNPVISEAVIMAAAQVQGNDATIACGGQWGGFQLNTMLPVIAYNLLQSIELLANSARVLADKAIADFTVNADHIRAALDRNPVLVTALNERIGYEKGAEIAKRAYAEGRAVKEVAREMTGLSEAELDELLDPARLTRPSGE